MDLPLNIPPGMVATESRFAIPGRVYDGSNIRTYRDRFQKIGGWEKFSATQYEGYARSLHGWSDHDQNQYVMVGANCKLQAYGAGLIAQDVTPLEASGTLGTDPFDTTASSTTVTVNHTAHTREIDDIVIFDGATAVGGITIDGEYTVSTVPDANSYTIEHTSAATSTASGGGASVTYEYLLTCGAVDTFIGDGWGTGTWGTETWGTARTSSTYIIYARYWAMHSYGEDLIVSPTYGGIYHYDVTNPTTRAAAVTNAPTSCLYSLVTDERTIMALGADSESMKVKWSDQTDITIWTPAAANTAGERTLQEGSRLISAAVLQARLNLVWSDTALYVFQYTGTSSFYDSRIVGRECGIIGPGAHVIVDGVAYWMGETNFFLYNGAVQKIPNVEDIREFVFDGLNQDQKVKCFAGYNQRFEEIWWWYPSGSSLEPDKYVFYNTRNQKWFFGTMSRSAFTNQEHGEYRPLLTQVTDGGYIYQHENGVNDDGSALAYSLKMAPIALSEGNFESDVHHYHPDFETQVGDVTLNFTTYEAKRTSSELDNIDYTITTSDEEVDTRVSGRFIEIGISGNTVSCDFRLGMPLFDISEAGQQT